MFIGYALFVWPVHWVFPLCLPCSLFTDKHHWRPALDITCTTCRLLFIFCQSGSVTTALGCGGWDWGMLNCEKKTSGEQTLFRPYWGVFVMLHASTRIFQHPAVLLLFPWSYSYVWLNFNLFISGGRRYFTDVMTTKKIPIWPEPRPTTLAPTTTRACFLGSWPFSASRKKKLINEYILILLCERIHH